MGWYSAVTWRGVIGLSRGEVEQDEQGLDDIVRERRREVLCRRAHSLLV